jgi:phosphotransferase system HPr (HPr) family protein
MEARARVRLVNPRGLHARPCHAIASTALRFTSALRVGCDGREADGKSILELMTLGAGPGAELVLAATGDDAEALVEELSRLVAAGFAEVD